MAIKPVDFQVQIPKTTELSKASSHDNQKNLTFQQQQATLTQQLAEGSLSKVYSREKADSSAIRERQRENENRKRKNGGRLQTSGGSTQDDKEANEPPRTSTIDIKI
ncbi:MAG: hypothetical protein HGA22_00625 [Clostridiales bacterium]|nr:hypothetical protein [Clostridiales bacterium]